VTAPIVRRLPLPADLRSPAAARSAVRAALLDAGNGIDRKAAAELLDEALLLTTELVTNAVLHAGTELIVEIAVDPNGITVSVLDSAPEPGFGPGADAADAEPPSDERGRGLILVNEMADRWGTVYHRRGKVVWFRLSRDVSGSTGPLWPTVDPVAALGPVPDGTDLLEQLEELLRRLTLVTGAAAVTVLVDENDGVGPRALSSYTGTAGTAAKHSETGLRISLTVARPWRAELVVHPPLDTPVVHLAAERIGLLLENHRLRRTDLERRSWLTFLAEASDLLAQSLDVELTMALIPRLVVPRLGTWCAVHMLSDEGELRLAACTHRDETQTQSLMEQLEAARPQLIETVGLDGPVALSAPAEGIAVALIGRGQRMGTLSVGRDVGTWQGADEQAAIEDLARRSALAIDNNRIYAERRSIAHELQRSLLPPELPIVQGIDLGAEYVPAGEAVDVGGDFYDVVALPDGRWLIVIGDVSGKGVQAAIVTGLVRDVTRTLVRDGRPLADTLTRLNEALIERGAGRFCTLALAALSRRPDGVVDAALHLAGHDQPVLVHPDGRTRLVGRCGTALGLLPVIKTPVEHLVMRPGDMLIFTTDGVTERRHRTTLFGVDRLRREASALAGFSAEVVAARLRAAAVAFSPDPPRDDIAVLIVRNES
jgi:sigma-B regulation protein RsbU (phosphoserine phosphatase)